MSKSYRTLSTFLLAFVISPPLARCAQPAGARPKAPSLESSIARCESRFSQSVKPSDELYDYFRLSLQIIQRGAAILKSPETAPGDSVYHAMVRYETQSLASFYEEELTVASDRAKRTPKILNVTEYGLSGNNRTDNRVVLAKLLDKVRAGKSPTVLQFPEGRYRFSGSPASEQEERKIAVLLRDLHGLTLEGRGKVTFVVDGTEGPGSIFVENCKDIQIRNIDLDMDPLPFTTGTVAAVNSEQSTFEMTVAPDQRRPDDVFFRHSSVLRGKLRDPKTGNLYNQEGDLRVVKVEAVADGRYRLRVAEAGKSSPPGLTAPFRKGLLFVLYGRSDSGRGNGIDIRQSEHVLVRNVNVYAASIFGVYVLESAGVQFIDCNLEPAPGRLALNTADGFHVPGNRKGPYLERCNVHRVNDDCMNFYSRAEAILRVAGPRQLSISHPAAHAEFRPGDLIGLIDLNTGMVDAVMPLASVQTGQWHGQPSSELLFSEPLPAHIESRDSTGRGPASGREYVLSGGESYRKAMANSKPFEHDVVDLSLKNDGFIVRNSSMGDNRGGGFKCKSSNGILENWQYSGGTMAAISMKVGLDWREAFYPHNVLLEGCKLGSAKDVVVYGGLPGGKTVFAPNLPWVRDIDARNCVDASGHALKMPAPIRVLQ